MVILMVWLNKKLNSATMKKENQMKTKCKSCAEWSKRCAETSKEYAEISKKYKTCQCGDKQWKH